MPTEFPRSSQVNSRLTKLHNIGNYQLKKQKLQDHEDNKQTKAASYAVGNLDRERVFFDSDRNSVSCAVGNTSFFISDRSPGRKWSTLTFSVREASWFCRSKMFDLMFRTSNVESRTAARRPNRAGCLTTSHDGCTTWTTRDLTQMSGSARVNQCVHWAEIVQANCCICFANAGRSKNSVYSSLCCRNRSRRASSPGMARSHNKRPSERAHTSNRNN